MQNNRFLVVFLLCTSLISRGQNTVVIQDYITTYRDLAIKEMQRTGVPAAIKLAQGIHETMAGTSDLVLKSNNHFGIKCKDTWMGESVRHDDDLRGECFRKYTSAEDSYRDHSDFLKGSSRYASLFLLDPTDYEGWAYGLKKAGYATNPRYSQVIIKLIEDYHLEDYTMIALGKMPEHKDPVVMVAATDTKSFEKAPEAAIVKTVELVKKEPVKATIQPVLAVKQEPLYPNGEFKVNETRVIYAKKGTSFLAIAEQYSVPLARVFEFNDKKEMETVDRDHLIYLQRKRKTGTNEFHIVKTGETLLDIAQEEALRIESLLEYNWLKIDMHPAIGEQLNLRSKSAEAPKLVLKENYSVLAAAPPGTTAYPAILACTVQAKETIYAIAKRYKVKIDDIVKWNQLSNYDLKTGQEIKIYK